MKTRTKARTKAFEILFEASQRDVDPVSLYQGRLKQRDPKAAPPNAYIQELIAGVSENQEKIDETIASFAQGWTLRRMPNVDLTLLRIGTWEILFNDEVPVEVVLSEAVALAREFSGDKSPKFVNGVLGRIDKMKETLQ
ncbi:MAG: transcription antitermination factor NusB [Micrococcaceae bacterium]